MSEEIKATVIIKEAVRLLKKYPEVRSMMAHNYLKGMEQVAMIGFLCLTAKNPKFGLLRKGLVIGSAVVAYAMSLEYRVEMEVAEQLKFMEKVNEEDLAGDGVDTDGDWSAEEWHTFEGGE